MVLGRENNGLCLIGLFERERQNGDFMGLGEEERVGFRFRWRNMVERE